MRGLIQVTATKGGRTITTEVFGDLADRENLFGLLMNRHKINHSERNLWKLSSVVINEELNL